MRLRLFEVFKNLLRDFMKLTGPCSLRKFIGQYSPTSQPKGHFPHFLAQSVEQLMFIKLPLQISDFHDPVGNTNMLNENFAFNDLINVGYSKKEAGAKLKLRKLPSTVMENFKSFEKFCLDRNCQTLFDVLIGYLEIDTVSMMEACIHFREQMSALFNVDCTHFISISRLGFTILGAKCETPYNITTRQCFFALNEEAYNEIGRLGLKGGLASALSSRLAYRGSQIKPMQYENPEIVDNVGAWDANQVNSCLIGHMHNLNLFSLINNFLMLQLYGSVLQLASICWGSYVKRERKDNFKSTKLLNVSKIALLAFSILEIEWGMEPFELRTCLHAKGEVTVIVSGRTYKLDACRSIYNESRQFMGYHVIEFQGRNSKIKIN